MPPNAGTRTSTRQGRATVRPTNYYARSFAGRLAANGMEQTPEASHAAPGFLPALTHFTGAVDAFPKEIIRQFSMFKEVEAKLHDPEQLLKDLLEEISQVPVATKAQRQEEQGNRGAENGANPSQSFDNLSPSARADVKRRQLFFRLRMLVTHMIPILDEKLVVLQSTKAIKDKGLTRMHHSYCQLDNEISDEARYGSLTHWAYADNEEKKKGVATHERQRREVVAANNLAAAAQHVHDVDSIAAKSEARREAVLANKRSRHQQVDSDFDDRPAKRPQKKKALAADAPPSDGRNLGLGISNGAGPNGGKRKKTEKALAAASLAAPPMERSLSGAMRAAGSNGGRAGSSPRATPAPEGNAAAKRKQRAAPAPTQRKNHLAPQSPTLAPSPLAANFAINKIIGGPADRPLSARARKSSTANSTTSASAQETSIDRRPSTSHSVQLPPGSSAITELEQAAGISREMELAQDNAVPQGVIDMPQPMETTAMKQEEHEQFEATPNTLDLPTQAAYAARTGRTSKTATPVVGAFPEVPMARSRSTRHANNGNSNSNPSSENNSTTTGSISKRNTKKTTQAVSAALASPALKATPTSKSNPPSTASSVAPDLEADYAEADSDVDSDEPRYCYCNQVSYGNMVACDNDDCPREWFHLPCVNLDKAPIGRTKWFCSDECEEVYKKAKSKAKGGRPGSSRQ